MSWIDDPTDGRSNLIGDDPYVFGRSRGHGTEIPFAQGNLHIRTRACWPDPPMAVSSGSAFWSWSPEATR